MNAKTFFLKGFTKVKETFFSIPPLFVIIFTFIIGYSLFSDIPTRQRGGFFSDEAVYFSMIQSIAYDLDIKFEKRDIYRIRRVFPAGPNGIFLKKGKGGNLFYAKSFAYPLFAAPFFRLFGVNGIILFNGILLILVLLAGYSIGKKVYPKFSKYVVVFFVFCSIAGFYFVWITPDLFNFSIVFLSLFLFFNYKDENKIYPIILSALLIGIASFSKLPNVFIAALPGFYFFFIKRDFKKLFIFSSVFLLTFVSLYCANYRLTGEINYMGGERKSFYFKFPYEEGVTFKNSGYKMSAGTYWERYSIDADIALKNLFYSFFGRFSGIFIYFFPAFVFLVLYILDKRKTALKTITLILYSFIHLFYIIMIPSNYLGGAGSLGNRYFLNFIPFLFFLLPENLTPKKLLLFSLFPVLIFSPVYIDTIYYSAYTGELSKTPLLSIFPPDLTQIQSVPTNTNPWAFRQSLTNSKIYVLNNNFNIIKDERAIIIQKRGKIEFVLETTKLCKSIYLELQNNPLNNPNRIKIKIGGKKVNLTLKKLEKRGIRINNIKPSLIVRKRFYYYGVIKTSTDVIPYYIDFSYGSRRLFSLKFKPIFEKCVE